MKISLFSDAHLDSAQSLWGEKINDIGWLSQQWNESEINEAKAYELKNFPGDTFLNEASFKKIFPYTQDEVLDYYIEAKINGKVISIGCGPGHRERLLLDKNKDIEILALDNAPYTEKLNQLISDEEKAKKLIFKNDNGKKLKKDELFDVLISHAVIYCIPDEELAGFFESMIGQVKCGGRLIISCSSFLSFSLFFKSKMRILLNLIWQKRFPTGPQLGQKQTGWMRSINQVKSFIPLDKVDILRIDYLGTTQNVVVFDMVKK